MSKKAKADAILDWTITDAPEADEAPPGQPAVPIKPPPDESARRGGRVPLRGRLIAAALVAAPLLWLGLSSAWDRHSIRQQVEQVVALEEQAALDGDIDRLREIYAAEDGLWLRLQMRQAENGEAAPRPMPLLQPVPEPGVVQAVESFAADVVRADVARLFIAPDGSRAMFALPQFYRYADGEWNRIEPPDSFRGDLREWSGRYVDLEYYVGDEAIVAELGPYLDDVLAQTCAAWACPDGLKFEMLYSHFEGQAFSFRVAEPATGSIREVFDSGDLDLQVESWSGWGLMGDWSPTGERIAFAVSHYADPIYVRGWAGVASPDGGNLVVLAEEDAAPALGGFSADGKLLAVTFHAGMRPQKTIIYDAATGEQRRALPQAVGSFAWAPSGHAIALISHDGLYVIAEPGDPESEPEHWLKVGGCYGLQWNSAQ